MSQFWRTSLLTGVGLMLETCSFYLLFTIVSTAIQVPQSGVPLGLVFLTLLWAFLLSLYLQTIRFSLNLRGAMGLIISVVSLLILSNLSAGFGLIPLAALFSGSFTTLVTLILTLTFLVVLWWRGASIAQDEMTLDTIRSAFQFGLVIVIVAVLIDALTSAAIINGYLIFAFFAIGLGGLSLSRFSSDFGESQVMSRDWLLPIAASVGAVLLLALLISGIGLGGLDDVVRAILKFIGFVGLWILKPILLGLGLVAAGLVALGNWIASMFGGGDLTGLETAQEQIRQFHESLEDVEGGGPPALLIAALKFMAFLIGAALVGWILFRLFQFRRLFRDRGNVEETRESLFTWERANQDLVGMIGGWWNALMHGSGKGASGSREPEDPRELYHSFLMLSGELGYPRQEWQTPSEHQRTVDAVLPTQPVARVIDGFQNSHYGHKAVEGQAMDLLLRDWAVIRQHASEQQEASESGPG